MKCVVFTNNQKKCQEIQELVATLGIQVVPYQEIVQRPINVVEDGQTFEQNAIKKLSAIDYLKEHILLADDSGLEISYLGGNPGVFSARFGGESLTDLQRCEHVLRQLIEAKDRSAQFRCVIACKFPGESVFTTEGHVRGKISFSCEGNQGFGYDPIFIPEGHEQTFSVLGSDIKHTMSHRFKALEQVQEHMSRFLEQTPNRG